MSISPVPWSEALRHRTFTAALFDLDGTLVDSTPAVTRAWTGWAASRGLPTPDLARNHGRPAADLVRALVPAKEVPAALADFQQRELTDLDGIVLLDGAAELLAAAPRAAIVTSCTRPLALARIGAGGVDAPAVIVTVDDVQHGKPHPDPFLLAARLLGVDPADCLVVEDAPAGLTAAAAAGCPSLAVLGTHTAAQLLGADLIVRSLADVDFVPTGVGFRVARPAGRGPDDPGHDVGVGQPAGERSGERIDGQT